VRIAARPDAWSRNPEHQELFAKVRAGTAAPEERARFRELHEAESRKVLGLEPDSLYEVQEVGGPPPSRARIHVSVVCARCGEAAMETRIRRLGGRELCTPCFEAAPSGEEPVGAPVVRRP